MTVAYEAPPALISSGVTGDPFSALATGGIGSQGCCGVGDAGPGGIGTAGPSIGMGSRPRAAATRPQLIYKVEPEFSEEARKAKYQGVVVLAIEVDAAGRARNLRILQGLGLGLDEKAMEAVEKWRFRPGYLDGKPVVTAATVEVRFRLL
jgi:protein TonB